MRRLTRRRQVKKRGKYSRHNKYKKTRSRKYIKKRRGVTRRRVLRGGDERHSPYSNHIIEVIVTAIANSRPERFKLLVDGLEIDPTILYDYRLQQAYKYMIELLLPDGTSSGYIGLTGLKFLNYLWARIKKLIESSKIPTGVINQDVLQKYKNLQKAISLMDQLALAPGVTCEQLNKIRELAPNSYYYKCYEYLFKELSSLMSLSSRNIPVSSSACRLDGDCDVDSCDSNGECCSPRGLPTD